MTAAIIAEFPQRVGRRVAARQCRRPREDQPAFDDPRSRKAALARVHFIEMQGVAVARQHGHLHVLAFADGATGAVQDHVAFVKVFK